MISFLYNILTVFFAAWFLVLAPSFVAAQTSPSLSVVPASIDPGGTFTLKVSGVSSEQYLCVYVEGTPDLYNDCSSKGPYKASVGSQTGFVITIPKDTIPNDYKINVGLYDGAERQVPSQVISKVLKVNTASAQTTVGGYSYCPNVGDSTGKGACLEASKCLEQCPGQCSIAYPTKQTCEITNGILSTEGAAPGTSPDRVGVGAAPAAPTNEVCTELGLTYDTATGLCLPSSVIVQPGETIQGSRTVGEVIVNILKILLTLAGVVAAAFIVIGGYQYVTSRGSEDAAKKGRSTITSAVIGLVAVLLAYTLVNILTNLITGGTGSLFS